jgi:hypothetical protein
MAMHESDASKITAECLFWYWSYKKMVILKVGKIYILAV